MLKRFYKFLYSKTLSFSFPFPIFSDIKVGPMSQWQMTINHWNGYGWRDFNCCQMSSKSSLSLSSKSNSGEKVIINSYEINQIFKRSHFLQNWETNCCLNELDLVGTELGSKVFVRYYRFGTQCDFTKKKEFTF